MVLFDGDCSLCNRGVRFMIRHSRTGRFEYLPLRSAQGAGYLRQHGFPEDYGESIVLIDGDQSFVKSDAALRIAVSLNGVWKILTVFRLVPRVLRDKIYDWIGRNRFHWFGRDHYCEIHSDSLS